MLLFILLLMSLFAPGQILAASPALEIFDAHIHYSGDVWDKLSPQRVLELRLECLEYSCVGDHGRDH